MPDRDQPQHVTIERAGTQRRWTCPCGWTTTWTVYTDHASNTAAIRHEADHYRREGTQWQA